jgi:hypothetical protein
MSSDELSGEGGGAMREPECASENGSDDVYNFTALRTELELLQTVDDYSLLKRAQLLIDDLLLELLTEVNYATFHPFLMCHRGDRSVLDPIHENDHSPGQYLAKACDCVGASIILYQRIKGLSDEFPSSTTSSSVLSCDCILLTAALEPVMRGVKFLLMYERRNKSG